MTTPILNATERQRSMMTSAQQPPSLEELRDDPAAECRWWNSLSDAERLAYIHGARGPSEYAAGDWLDIGETNRMRILDAAFAVECWKQRRTG